MKWYRDNGVLTLLMPGVLVLLPLLVVTTCNSCLEEFWNVATPPNEQTKRETL